MTCQTVCSLPSKNKCRFKRSHEPWADLRIILFDVSNRRKGWFLVAVGHANALSFFGAFLKNEFILPFRRALGGHPFSWPSFTDFRTGLRQGYRRVRSFEIISEPFVYFLWMMVSLHWQLWREFDSNSNSFRLSESPLSFLRHTAALGAAQCMAERTRHASEAPYSMDQPL